MFERFTDRARQVMALANEHALRFEQDFVSTEDILIAICIHNGGMSGAVFKRLGVSQGCLRARVEESISQSRLPIPHAPRAGKLPNTPHANRAIEHAILSALGLPSVGTEHLLVGLASRSETIAGLALQNRGMPPHVIREQITEILKESEKTKVVYRDSGLSADVVNKSLEWVGCPYKVELIEDGFAFDTQDHLANVVGSLVGCIVAQYRGRSR